jgi:aspartate/methionine/tyrosine aminotransferase
MGVFDRLSRLVAGGPSAATQEAAAALAQSYCDCAGRAAQLLRHAGMAPQQQSAEALRQLAAAEEERRDRLRQALEAAGAQVPSAAPETPPRGALSHWARLVQDLEAHRDAVQRFRELAIRFAESFPQTAGLFDELCREEAAHCEDLRALIARADPQALD